MATATQLTRKPVKTSKDDCVSIVRKHLRSLELGKKRYKQADAAMTVALTYVQPGQEVMVGEKKFRLVDKWAGKNQVVAISFARRYEFEEVPQP